MIKRLNIDGKEIVLVGTAHISKKSVELVEKTIEEENPDIVGVELDKDRFQQLMSGKKWENMNIMDVVKTGKTYLFLLNILLSNLQKQLGSKIGIKPGAEMLAAINKSKEQKKSLVLLDRDIRITLKRAFSAMKLREKIWLGSSILSGFFGKGEVVDEKKIEELKNEDLINTLMKELGKQMPSVKKTLVDERDDYITEMIRKSPGKKIVAIVGAGHLNGIAKNLEENKKINLKELITVQKKRNYLKIIKYLVPVLFLSLLSFLFFTQGPEATIQALIIWFLANGTFSAIGAAMARAHPISIIAAFLAAPLTSLHPAIAAGWVAAITETKFNPPRVIDFQDLNNVSTMRGFYKNKVTHILIVTAFTNVGSVIGTIIALPFLIELLL